MMYILIGGAGMTGLALANTLLNIGHTIAIVDPDPLACHMPGRKLA